ncbi:hypothetical protein ACHAWF_002843, partial [Thalassiosira exigua]
GRRGGKGTKGGDGGKGAGKRGAGVKFAWQDEDEDGDGGGDDDGEGAARWGSGMRAAPTLADIMDEKDERDLLAPPAVGGRFRATDAGDDDDDAGGAGESDPGKRSAPSRRRRRNAALEELARVAGTGGGGGGGGRAGPPPSGADESIGWRLLKVLGYRRRLGVAYVPVAGRAGGREGVEAALNELEREGEASTHERRWLASRGLRAVRLPRVEGAEAEESAARRGDRDVLRIPPPKTDRHGMGYDPFRNAPEFRAFHERRREMARARGREPGVGGEGGGGRGDRYFTDDLRGGRAPWDRADREGEANGADNDDDDDEGEARRGDRSESKGPQHAHYAADRDYRDFVGTHASSGFALEDEDDADVYREDAGPTSSRLGGGGDDGGIGGYEREVQSPVASDEEEGGLFAPSAAVGAARGAPGKKRTKAEEGGADVADAWGAWGAVEDGESGVAAKTMDGKPPLPGFQLGRELGSGDRDRGDKPDAPKRWRGPMPPSGYVLKRHVFPKDDGGAAPQEGHAHVADAGLGLDLRRLGRRSESKPGSFVPKVLPPSTSRKMLARDGTKLNFHAVKESMKSRFTSAATKADAPAKEVPGEGGDDAPDRDAEEWVNVSVASWIPTRLFCKRWGVPMPSTEGASAAAAGLAASTRTPLGREEEYFRRTVYEPVASDQIVANRNGKLESVRKDAAGPMGPGMLPDGSIEEDDGAPPPTRPSEAAFRSVFDADDSDMDISSSDDEEEDQRQKLDAGEDLNRSARTDSLPTNGAIMGASKLTVDHPLAPKENSLGKEAPDAEFSREIRDNDNATSKDGNQSRGDQSPERRLERRFRGPEIGDYASDKDRERRKKKERRRRKHSRREDSSDDSDVSDGSNSSSSSADRQRRSRKKKHRHRS